MYTALFNDSHEAAAAALEKRALTEQLRRLEEREEVVLRARFGIDGVPLTLAEIGDTGDGGVEPMAIGVHRRTN